MRYFFEMYPDTVICPQVEDELITEANRPQVGDDLQIIFRIPWGHNKNFYSWTFKKATIKD